MMPMPETSPSSSSRRLIPAVRRRTFATNRSSSNSGSNGSRAMWAISAGSSAPPSDTARPPNIRWSTNRSSRSPRSNRTRRWRASRLPGSLTRSCPLMPMCPSSASPVSSGSHRYFPRRWAASNGRPGSAVANPDGPRWSRRTGRGCSTATESTVRPTTWRSRPSRTVTTSGSTGTVRVAWLRSAVGRLGDGLHHGLGERVADAQGRGQLAVRRLRGGLLGLLLGAADAVAVAVVADPHLRGEGLHVGGALGGDEVLRDAEAGRGGELLQGGLPVQPGAQGGGGLDQRVEQQVDDHGAGLEPTGEMHGADHRLDGVGQDRRLLAATGRGLATTVLGGAAQPDLASHAGQRAGVDDGGAQLGEVTFGEVGVDAVERLGDHAAEHRVAEELQALVGRQATVLVGVRAVRQRALQQLGVQDRLAEC